MGDLVRTKRISQELVCISLILVATIVLFEYISLDIWLQDHFFNFELKKWILDRNDRVTRFVFYDGIKKVFILSMLSILIGLVFFKKAQFIQKYRQGLLIVCLSAIFVPLIVGGLKAVTNTPCPRDITRYNGRYPYVTVLTAYPQAFEQNGRVKCFPAAHASGGFSLLSMMFLFKKRREKLFAFFAGMALGWSTGIYKMLIGDHFLSHTLVTMILAWFIIVIIAVNVRRYCYLQKDIPPKKIKSLQGLSGQVPVHFLEDDLRDAPVLVAEPLGKGPTPSD